MSSRHHGLLIAALLAALLAGCGNEEPEDVREWMRSNSAGLKGKIPDLPQMKPLPAVVYEPGELVSPFSPDKLFADDVRANKARGVGAGGPRLVNPDAYPLTRFALENIRMIGTMTFGKEIVAVVSTDRDAPRQVRVGDYVGQNFGKVTAIRPASELGEGEISVKEMVLEKGAWVERENRITQPIQGEKK